MPLGLFDEPMISMGFGFTHTPNPTPLCERSVLGRTFFLCVPMIIQFLPTPQGLFQKPVSHFLRGGDQSFTHSWGRGN